MVGQQNSQENLERFHQALDVADTVLDFSKGLGSGMLTAGAETATGLIDAVLHPIDTAKGFAQAVLHLDILFDQAISSVVKVIDEYPEYSPEKKGEVVGEISFHVASAWFSMGFGKAGATATNLARAGKVEALAQCLEKVVSSAKKIGISNSTIMQEFAQWLKKPLHPKPERGAIGNHVDKTLELIKSLRPEKATLQAGRLFEDVPKPLRPNVWDIMENLPQAMNGNAQARSFIDKLRPHELTANFKGWTSLDLVPNNPSASPLRFLYKREADGTIKWLIKDTH